MWNTPIRSAAAATTSGMQVKGASNRQSDGRNGPVRPVTRRRPFGPGRPSERLGCVQLAEHSTHYRFAVVWGEVGSAPRVWLDLIMSSCDERGCPRGT